MKITVSGHHVKVTQGIREAIERKFAKIAKHFPSILHLDSVIRVEPNRQQLEVTTLYEGEKISVRATAKELYMAIAEASGKLEAALKRRKGMMSKKLHTKYQVPQSALFEPAN